MDYRVYNRRLFKKYLAIYDLSELVLSRVRVSVDDYLQLPKGSMILDIACGTGNQSMCMAKEGYDVTGVDISPEMLLKAKQKGRIYRNLHLMVADATVLPFEDNLFDASIITFSLHDTPREIGIKAIGEMSRVTKPTGKIIILDYNVTPRKTFFEKGMYYVPKIWESKYYSDYHTHDISFYLQANHMTQWKEFTLMKGIAKLLIADNLKATTQIDE